MLLTDAATTLAAIPEAGSMVNSITTDDPVRSGGEASATGPNGPAPNGANTPRPAGKSESRPLRERKRRLVERDARVPAGPRAEYGDQDPLAHLNRVLGPVDPAIEGGRVTCGARTRKGSLCLALGGENGRCRNHGSLATGPRTAAGWAKTRAGYWLWLDKLRRLNGPSLA
jgi:hypothetical protein